MTLYAVVALGDLGIIVHIYFSDTDMLVLALRRVPELNTQSVILMGTGAKLRPVKVKLVCNTLGPDKINSSRVSCTYWCKHHWTQDTGKENENVHT